MSPGDSPMTCGRAGDPGPPLVQPRSAFLALQQCPWGGSHRCGGFRQAAVPSWGRGGSGVIPCLLLGRDTAVLSVRG